MDRGCRSGCTDAGCTRVFRSTSGARGLQAASAEEVGTEGHEGGGQRGRRAEVGLKLTHRATGAVTLSSLSLSVLVVAMVAEGV